MRPRGLHLVPGCESGDAPKSVAELPSGRVNDVYRIGTSLGDFVLHEPKSAPLQQALGVDLARQIALQGIAAEAGLAPQVVAACASSGSLVTRWVPGRTWSDLDAADSTRLRELCEVLAALHRLSAPDCVAIFDPITAIKRVMNPLRPLDRQRLDVACRDYALVRSAQRGVAIGHGDLQPANLLQTPRLMLLDWEYAQLGDPLLDLAGLIACQPGTRVNAPQLLQWSGLHAIADVDELLALARVLTSLNEAWERRARA